MKRRLLVVEDERGLAIAIRDRLRSEGYLVETESDGAVGFQRAADEAFDAIVLDVMLPNKNGFDICRDLRARNVVTPIIMLTARGQLVDRVLGLKLGADDYLSKPFEMLELLARLEALLRRGDSSATTGVRSYRFGEVRVDFERGEVRRNSEPVVLTAKEYQLLRHLIERRGKLLSRDELLDRVWGYDAMPVTRTVDVHISGLRRKLEPDPDHPRYILTVHRLGYKFVG